ncbi:TetR/AcrR family transcriptional regulator [Patulibacter brassicae]|uniref:TetR/AcrR family transcriptional regulator n=1 Tax=Patulibacter brassicae TaxID=1705717 RepID=A0ABU4VN42_9ACTN|nr:TetR/AcrR family transcriptional regulator [Patulibacter brassicae]MDX8153266.1 TetR/AcrR family transcriptional regulator [Patulibacter brassicae]
MSDAASRRTRKRERMYRNLLDATAALIAEDGTADLRISDITERADVALGSFYNYFASKEEIVDAVARETLSALAASLAEGDEATAGDDAAIAARAIRRFVDLAREDELLARLLVNLSAGDAVFVSSVHPAARRAVERGVAHGRFTVGSVELSVVAITGGALALVRAIIDGLDVGPEPGRELAERSLLALGVPPQEAARVAARV